MTTLDLSQIKANLNNLTDSLNRVGEISNGLMMVADELRKISVELEQINRTFKIMENKSDKPTTPPPYNVTSQIKKAVIPPIPVSDDKSAIASTSTTETEIPDHKEVIYFLNPDGNGFNRQAPLPIEEAGRAKYELTLQNPTKATFKPLSSALPLFKTSPNILTSLCDIMSGDLDTASEIFVYDGDQGTVVVEGGYWECTDKCKIELR